MGFVRLYGQNHVNNGAISWDTIQELASIHDRYSYVFNLISILGLKESYHALHGSTLE